MYALVLVMTGAFTALYFFGMGRAVCPVPERTPWQRLDTDDVVHTIKRGWAAGGVDFDR